MNIAICIVTLNCAHVIRACLDSIAASEGVQTEIIIVDNASLDDTVSIIQNSYPHVELIRNLSNVGFSIATNQGIRASTNEFILWLNPDTILRPDSLARLAQFLANTPAAGIAGPKVLNEDGTFQPQCKRGKQTPLTALMHLTGLGRLMPQLPGASEYLLGHLSPDLPHQVTAVSGCCLLARRTMAEQIGLLDEAIFGFGEDVDWCVRAAKAGWQVWYRPESVITHLKGQGGAHSQPYRKAWALHQAMWIFYRKHLQASYSPIISVLFWLGLRVSLGLSYSRIWLKRC